MGGALLAVVLLGILAAVGARLLVTDAQLATWVEAALNKQFLGRFQVGRLHWQLPATVTLQDVVIHGPGDAEAAPTLRAEHAQVSASLAGFAHHQVNLYDITLEGVRLQIRESDPDTLNIAAAFLPRAPADPNPEPSEPWTVELDGVEIVRSEVLLELPTLQLHAGELALQHGAMQMDDSRLSLTAALQTQLRVGPEAAPQFAAPVRLRADDAVLQLATEALDMRVRALDANLPGATVRASGGMQGGNATLDADAELNPNSLVALPAAVRDLLAGSARLHARVRSSGAQVQADLQLAGQGLQVAQLPVESVALVAQITPPRVAIEHLQVQTGAGALDANGTLAWTETGVGEHALHLQLRDARLRRLLSQLAIDPKTLPEHATAEVTLSGSSLWPLGSHAQVHAEAQGLPSQPVPGLPASLAIDGSLDATPTALATQGLQLSGDGVRLAVRGRWPMSLRAHLDMEATLKAAGLGNRVLSELHVPAQVQDLTFTVRARGPQNSPTLRGALRADGVQTQGRTLQVQVPFTFSGGALQVVGAGVQSPWARVQVNAELQLLRRGKWLQDPPLQARLHVPHVQLDGLVPDLTGAVQVEATVHGSAQHPAGEATVQVERLRYAKAAFTEASAHAQLTREGATLTRLHVQPDSGGALDANGTATWATHAVTARAQVRDVALPWLAALAGAGEWAGSLEADAQVDGTWDAPAYHATAQLRDAHLQQRQIDALRVEAHGGLQNLQATLHTAGQGTTLEAQADVDLTRQLLRASADGVIDVALVSAIAPSVGTMSGRLGLQLSAEGPLQSPRPRGSLRLVEAVIWHPRGGVGDVRLESLDMALEPTVVALRKARGSWGTGSFALDGQLDLADLRPHGYRLRVHGDDLPVRTADLFLEANLNLQVTSEDLFPSVRGVVEVTHGRYTKEFALHDFYFVATHKNTDLPLAQTAPWLSEVQLDVSTTTAAPIAIKVDAGAFAVQTALSADLRVTGSALHPQIGGSVNAEGGALHFPKADLQLTDAMVNFVPDRRGVPVPTLSLHAGADVTATSADSSTTTTNVYNVSLTLDGPLEKLGLDLQSSPILTRLEILALLATGHADLMELTQGNSSQSARMNAALAFAGSQLSEPLTRFAEQRLERLLNTRVDLSTEVSEDQIKLTASKRINPRLRLEGGYQQAWGNDPTSVSAVSGRAQLLLMDRLMLEGGAQRDTSPNSVRPTDQAAQGSLQLKWRIIGD